jgi:hypothetical protein
MIDRPTDEPCPAERWLRAMAADDYEAARHALRELREAAAKPPKEENPSTIERPPRSPGAGVRKSRGRRI